MRCLAFFSALSVLGCLGCDSDDPLRQGPTDFSFRVEAEEAPIRAIEVWDVYADLDRDGNPDDTNNNGISGDPGDITTWCEAPTELVTVTELIPWRFSMLIRLVRSGEVVTEKCIDSSQMTQNVTVYSHTVATSTRTVPFVPPELVRVKDSDPPEFTLTQGDTISRFRIANPRFISSVNPIATRSALNHIARALNSSDGACAAITFDPGLASFGIGSTPCGQTEVGPAGERLQPFQISLEPGDTITIDIRRDNGFNELGLPLAIQPALTGVVTIDGQPAAGIVGTTRTTSEPNSGFSFFYTRR